MTNSLDPRLVSVTVEVNGVLKTYSQGLMIKASGTKYANSLQNEADITLTNLDKATQDYLLTVTSPFNRNPTPKIVRLYAGRQSYGLALIFAGNIVRASVSQPPDIGVTLKCLTGNFFKGTILTRNYAGATQLSQIAKGVAGDIGAQLNFQATDLTVANYNFAGASLNQINALAQLANLNVYLDDNSLVVKNAFQPLTGAVRVLSAGTGMIGIPEFTEQGIKVKYLVDNLTRVGGAIQVVSNIYPAANGVYTIYKLGFEITSRDVPFYYTAEAAFKR